MGQIGAANAVSGNGGSAVLGPGGLGCTTILLRNARGRQGLITAAARVAQ